MQTETYFITQVTVKLKTQVNKCATQKKYALNQYRSHVCDKHKLNLPVLPVSSHCRR